MSFSQSPRTVFALQNRLRELTNYPIVLCLTDNRSTMLSRQRGVLRAHKMFLCAPERVVDGLADFFLRGHRRDCVQNFIEQNSEQIRRSPRQVRTPKISTRGNFFDLAEIAEQVNRDYFAGRSRSLITWGRRAPRRRTRVATLGHFDPRVSQITISRRLDNVAVPRYFVEYVVYHEMLHEILGIDRRADGKREIHGAEFKAREKQFAQYVEANEFEKRWRRN